MRQAVAVLQVQTPGRGLLDVTQKICSWAAQWEVESGLLTIFCRHTSASLLIQENASRAVRQDLEDFFADIAPEDPRRYKHDDEGPDDMPAHIRTALTGVQLAIPIIGGSPALGAWQGIFLFEHRRAPHRRELAVHILGEAGDRRGAQA